MQINRAVSSAINDQVLSEIMNIMGSLPLDQNGTGTGTYSSGFGIGNVRKKPNGKSTKKGSQSACNIRENADFTPYKYGQQVTESTSFLQLPQFENPKISP